MHKLKYAKPFGAQQLEGKEIGAQMQFRAQCNVAAGETPEKRLKGPLGKTPFGVEELDLWQ